MRHNDVFIQCLGMIVQMENLWDMIQPKGQIKIQHVLRGT